MCCVFALGALFPRLAIVLIALLTNWFAGVFPSWILPVLGFFLLPYTTLAYLALWHWQDGTLTVVGWLLVVLAAVIDLGNLGGGWARRKDAPFLGN